MDEGYIGDQALSKPNESVAEKLARLATYANDRDVPTTDLVRPNCVLPPTPASRF